MKKLLAFLLAFVLLLSAAPVVFADQYIEGYYRSDGTYVRPHWRSDPDGNPYNNYSYPGNINPYTGKRGTGNPDTYLDRYQNPYGYGTQRPPSRNRW